MKKNEAEFGEIKESKNAKQVLVDSKIVIQNPFEFPRQRENDDGNEKPEIAQFKASQRLLTSNASVTPNYIFPKIPKGESLKNESEVKIFTNCFKLQKQLKEASHRTIEKDKNVKAVKQELKDVAAEIRQQTYKTENSLKGGGCFDTVS
uniref:Uncharacterized protein n=1 Tax=Panagrolaimus sp. PS1159 TaxID=55785 RepID=A0AC35F3I3_9BILA